MGKLTNMLALGALSVAACGNDAAAPANEATAKPANAKLSLPLYEEAVVIKRPVLPARMADGNCPIVDRCEFGTEWRTCEAVPLYREAIDGAAVIRRLKPMETFVAETGEIELIAPGRIEVTDVTDPGETGGDYLEKGAVLEAYGPLHDGRALYFNPATGKAWSPPANHDHWWWDGKTSKMVSAPRMTWWVKARTKDGVTGWLRLPNITGADDFPSFDQAEVMETWDTHRTRDDETPDCSEMIRGVEADGTPSES